MIINISADRLPRGRLHQGRGRPDGGLLRLRVRAGDDRALLLHLLLLLLLQGGKRLLQAMREPHKDRGRVKTVITFDDCDKIVLREIQKRESTVDFGETPVDIFGEKRNFAFPK